MIDDQPRYSHNEAIKIAKKLNIMVDEISCPVCENANPDKITLNWLYDKDGYWYHECHKCGNVFKTKEKVKEE